LIEALEAGQPRFVIADHWVADLPKPVGAYLAEKYVPSGRPELWRRKATERAKAGF
jgi:hypothetical protein